MPDRHRRRPVAPRPARRPSRTLGLILGLLPASASPPAGATTVRALTADQVLEIADRVFEGRCVSSRVVEPDSLPFPVTEHVFEVESVVKGRALAEALARGETRLVIRQAGGRAPSGRSYAIAGMPGYEVGARYRLALHGDSSWGLTSPVGMGQGVALLEPPPSSAKVPGARP